MLISCLLPGNRTPLNFMRNLKYIFLFIFITNCATKTAAVLQTPSSITITSPMSVLDIGVPVTQEVYNIAQKHCQIENRNAVHISSWHVPFKANYHKFECKD